MGFLSFSLSVLCCRYHFPLIVAEGILGSQHSPHQPLEEAAAVGSQKEDGTSFPLSWQPPLLPPLMADRGNAGSPTFPLWPLEEMVAVAAALDSEREQEVKQVGVT